MKPQNASDTDRIQKLEARVAALEENSCDTIVLINVLEHIRDDQAALRELVRILRPGGCLLIFVPALAMLMSELDRVHGHFRRYHKGDLEAKLRAVPADIVHCSYFDAFGTLSWFVVNTVLRRTDFNPTLIHINDRYLVPLSRAVERLITPPFGKNLIVIAQKASDDHKIF
jgi:SAM-dependent methyltransferase